MDETESSNCSNGLLWPNAPPLHQAVQRNDFETVRRLVKQGENVREPNELGHTPLLLATWCGHLDIVKWLLSDEGGSDIRECDNDGDTPLVLAAGAGHLSTVQWLLRNAGSIVDECDNDGYTPLLAAARGAHLETIQWLLSSGGSDVWERDDDGCTALLLAVESGCLETVKWLVNEGGSKLTESDNRGNTPFLVAARNGKLDVAKWLLQHDCSYTNKTKQGNSALVLAVWGGHLEMVQWLVGELDFDISPDANATQCPILLAVRRGNSSITMFLLGVHHEGKSEKDETMLTQIVQTTTPQQPTHNQLLTDLALEGWLDVHHLEGGGIDDDSSDGSIGGSIGSSAASSGSGLPKVLLPFGRPWQIVEHSKFPKIFQFWVCLLFWMQKRGSCMLLPELVIAVVRFCPSSAFIPTTPLLHPRKQQGCTGQS